VANSSKSRDWAVALDGGTTNTRACLLREGRIVAVARRPVGVRDAVFTGGADPLAAAVRDCLDEVRRAAGGVEPSRIVAAGMLSAEVGLGAVPHVVAPAGRDELARGAVLKVIPEVADAPILFVPGVRTPAGPGPDGWAEADVMRGEECATLGAHAALGLTGAAVFLWPGSHTKLVAVDAAGRIARGYTTLAGEMTAALARHTLLAASVPADLPERLDPDAVAAGARLVAQHGLGRAAFLVRVADLAGSLGFFERAAFWAGAVAADDVAHLARHPILAGGVPVWVGGSAPRRGLYAALLGAIHPGPVTPLDDERAEAATAVGALAVAGKRRFVTRRRTGSTTRRPGR
jgi:2-dehydro-3-deoxygalactonokinase